MNIPEQLTRAISIRQPHLEQILRGGKLFEYRSRLTHIRERVYLYAAMKIAEAEYPGMTDRELLELPRGLIVGSVDIVSCEWDTSRECFAYGLERPTRYAEPFKVKGQPQPGFWRPQLAMGAAS